MSEYPEQNITFVIDENAEMMCDSDTEFDINNILQDIENTDLYDELKLPQIINYLVEYELNPLNSEIVSRRQSMWFYISELKNDKFMKKYLLWS